MAFLDDIAEDLRAITNGEFSRPVVVTATGFSPFTIQAIFDRNSLEVDGDNIMVLTDSAQFTVYLPDIENVVGYEIDENSPISFAIMSKNFRIKRVVRDAESLGVVTLRAA